MADYRLTSDELTQLQGTSRRTNDQREAYRINAFSLPTAGWQDQEIAEALLVEPDTVHSHCNRFRASDLAECLKVEYHGSDVQLSDARFNWLDLDLQDNLDLSIQDLA